MNALPTVPTLRAVDRADDLRGQVSAALRAALVSGQLRPGQVYSAPVLGEMLGVSATPVREAMLDLVREGLVEVLRNKGFKVAELTPEQVAEFVHVRHLLEVPTMGDIADSRDPRVAAALVALRPREGDMTEAADQADVVRFMGLDTEFHTDFLALSGNKELVKIVGDLRNRSRIYGIKDEALSGKLHRSVVEHMEMIDLALAGDRDGLEALVARHIGHVRTLWTESSTGTDE